MRVSHFFFLLMTYCLLFILDYGNDFRQKANSSNFFLNPSSKWVIKQQRQLATHLAQELLMSSAVMVQEVLQRRREP